MKKFEVSGEFILEAHKAACSKWKTILETKFPELFVPEEKGEEIIYEWTPKSRYAHSNPPKRQKFYFSVGDRVQIYDGSYHLNYDKTPVKESLGLSKPTGTILYNKCAEIYDWMFGLSTLNLLIQLEDGRKIFSAPNCVTKI
jgi:hypothetical protein